jgi:hypothetical protein
MEGTVTPENITINGLEYTPEDATQYLELGKKYKELEGKLNTSLDKVYPEYTRATQRNKELEDELKARDVKLAEFEQKNKPQIPEDLKSVREAARKAGLVDEDLLAEREYVKKSDLDEFFNQKQTQQKLVDNILTKSSSLEKEIDGSDGRVPYDSDAVLAYASAYNIEDLEEAYEKMNNKGNAKWKEAQLSRVEKPGLTTLRGGGKKEPEPVKVTDDNFKQLWDEQFGRNE